MAGGWSKRGGGIPMAERVRQGAAPVERSVQQHSVHEECPARHVWVSEALDGLGVKRPGLLVEWRQSAYGRKVRK